MAVPAAALSPELESSMLARASRILYTFTTDVPELSMTDVARRTGLPRSSVHRIMEQLVQLKALEKVESRYRLGLGMIELGALAAYQNRLRRRALPHLHALHKATGGSVHLAVRDGHEIVYLEKISGSPDGRIPSRLGGRQPAYCTGAGKALLAFTHPEELTEILARGMPARTPSTITRPEVLRRELAQIRERGVAFDREENYKGIFCMAAPLREVGGSVAAAISLAGPPDRMNTQTLMPPLLTTARNVWRTVHAPTRRAAPPTWERALPEGARDEPRRPLGGPA